MKVRKLLSLIVVCVLASTTTVFASSSDYALKAKMYDGKDPSGTCLADYEVSSVDDVVTISSDTTKEIFNFNDNTYQFNDLPKKACLERKAYIEHFWNLPEIKDKLVKEGDNEYSYVVQSEGDDVAVLYELKILENK